MGRSIIAEPCCEDSVNLLLKAKAWSIGLLIGQITTQKDYIVHVVCTPPPEVDSVVEESEDGEEIERVPEKRAEYPESLHQMEEYWVIFHAKQVLKMLTGGLTIIGIFVQAPEDMMKGAQMKIKQILYAIHKMQCRYTQGLGLTEEHSSFRALLQICSTTRKMSCKTFDANDTKCAASPADFKFQPFTDRLITLNSSLSLDIIIPIAHSNVSSDINKQIQEGLMPYYKSICSSLATINGTNYPGDQVLMSLSSSHQLEQLQQTSKKARSKPHKQAAFSSAGATNSSDTLLYNVNLYASSMGNTKSRSVSVTTCKAKLHVRGTIKSVAIIHNKATVHQATQAIYRDIIRSIQSRCELLCDEIQINEHDSEEAVVYETPRRILATVPDSCVVFCDYMFVDEHLNDSIERFQQLLDLTITEQQIQADIETLPEERHLAWPEQQAKESYGLESGDRVSQKPALSTFTLGELTMVTGGLLAVAAAVISFLYLGENL